MQQKPSQKQEISQSAKGENQRTQLEISAKIQLQEEIERQIGPLIPQGAKEQVVSRVVGIITNERFSGPIAHPRHLREYEDIVPGSANRIIVMAEKAQDHNISSESKIIQHQIDDTKRGMFYGVLVLILIILLAFTAGILGNNILSGLLLSTAVLGVVGMLIKGRSTKE